MIVVILVDIVHKQPTYTVNYVGFTVDSDISTIMPAWQLLKNSEFYEAWKAFNACAMVAYAIGADDLTVDFVPVGGKHA